MTSFRFERLGCFQYSEEDGTPAAELMDQVGHSSRTHSRQPGPAGHREEDGQK